MICPVCHRSDSRLPLVVAVLAVCCVCGWAFSGLLAWEIGRVRDEASRMPQAAVLSIPGHYPTVQIYREGLDVRDGVPENPLAKPNGRKK